MHNFYTQVSDILGTLADIVQPRSFEELERYGLDEGEPDLDGRHSDAQNFHTPPSLEAPDARNPAVYFQLGEVLARGGHAGEQEFRFPYERAAYLRLLPTNQRPYPSLAKLLSVFQEGKPCPMSEIRVGINSGRNRFGPIIYRLAEPEAPSNILSLTQSFETGELCAPLRSRANLRTVARSALVVNLFLEDRTYCKIVIILGHPALDLSRATDRETAPQFCALKIWDRSHGRSAPLGSGIR